MRVSAMGDVAMLPHALRALLAAYPDLKVTVLTRPLFKPFFEGLDVDFLHIDPAGRDRGVRALWRLSGRAKALGVDALADVHDVIRSKWFRIAMRLRGVRTARIEKGHLAKWMRLGSNPEYVQPLRHTVLRYCDTFRRLGFVFDDPAPSCKPVRPNPMGEKRGIWIGVAPFSAQQGKIYPLPLMRRVIEMLIPRCERLFIHGGGGAEQEFAREMERTYPNATALHGRVDLRGEIDLVAHLDCVVTMDSLVMHLASLTATPAVSVWGATHPSLGFLGYGCGSEGVVQIEGLRCRPCSVYGKKPCRYGDYRCLADIEPQRIVDCVERMLAAGSPALAVGPE